jgi:hypothetical protein
VVEAHWPHDEHLKKKTLCTTLVIPISSFTKIPTLIGRVAILSPCCSWSGIMEIYMMRSIHVMTLSSPSWGGRSLKCEDQRWSHHQLCTFLYDIIPFLHVHAPLFIVWYNVAWLGFWCPPIICPIFQVAILSPYCSCTKSIRILGIHHASSK